MAAEKLYKIPSVNCYINEDLIVYPMTDIGEPDLSQWNELENLTSEFVNTINQSDDNLISELIYWKQRIQQQTTHKKNTMIQDFRIALSETATLLEIAGYIFDNYSGDPQFIKALNIESEPFPAGVQEVLDVHDVLVEELIESLDTYIKTY